MNKLLLLIIAGLIVVAGRAVIKFINKASQRGTINKIKKNPSLAEEYASGLDIPYNKQSITKEEFADLVKRLVSSVYIGEYKILYAVPAGGTSVLVFTELSFMDYDTNINGKAGEVQKSAFHDFHLQFDGVKSEVNIHSALHETATDKFQKQEFLKNLLEPES